MADAVFRFQPAGRNITREADKLRRASRQMRALMISELRQGAEGIENIFSLYAPYDYDERDDYHLRENITVDVGTVPRVQATVNARAISPETGFDYLKVTRFGRGWIFPKSSKVLRWVINDEPQFAKAVKPWKPREDWVEAARPEVEQETRLIGERLGRTVYTRLLR